MTPIENNMKGGENLNEQQDAFKEIEDLIKTIREHLKRYDTETFGKLHDQIRAVEATGRELSSYKNQLDELEAMALKNYLEDLKTSIERLQAPFKQPLDKIIQDLIDIFAQVKTKLHDKLSKAFDKRPEQIKSKIESFFKPIDELITIMERKIVDASDKLDTSTYSELAKEWTSEKKQLVDNLMAYWEIIIASRAA